MKPLTYGLLILSQVLAKSAQVIVPNNLDFPNEGNTVSWPFTLQDLGITSRRYQQVYATSQFLSEAPEGGYINQLWFRQDMFPNSSGFAADFLDSVEINLSITTRSPDSLSPVFSENVGAVSTTVYGPSPLSISTAIGWAIIPLAQPFLYIPAQGNLLLDIRTVDASPYPSPRRTFDAQETLGDSISSVVANDVNASSGSVSSSGLVTLFEIEPIPEPSTWALLSLGLFGIWRFSARRNKSN